MIESRHAVTVEDLVKRALSLSSTSPSVLGARKNEFEARIREELKPFAPNGILEEELRSVATIFR